MLALSPRAVLLPAALALIAGTAHAQPGKVSLVSVGAGNAPANFPSQFGTTSDDGQTVAFLTWASNLFPGDGNLSSDVAARQVGAGTTQACSVSSAGVLGTTTSAAPVLSGNGRYVVFESASANLVPGDTNGQTDIFRRDLQTGQTELVSRSLSGGFAAGNCSAPSVSADGRYVAFDSLASNLVTFDGNGQRDIFVRDMTLGVTVRASVSSTGLQANAHSYHATISRDGRFVAFDSLADSLAPGDTNNNRDVFLRDLVGGTTTRISMAYDGFQTFDSSFGPAGMSADGRFVAYLSFANDIVPDDTNFSGDIFLYDRQTGTNELISVASDGVLANFGSAFPSVSGDGRFVAFASDANTLIIGDSNTKRDLFLRDRLLGTTKRVSVDEEGSQLNNWADHPQLSPDGRRLTFDSFATNAVAGDANGMTDVFVKELRCPADLSSDGEVDLTDFFQFLNDFDAGSLAADMTDDGRIDLADFFGFLNAFDAGC